MVFTFIMKIIASLPAGILAVRRNRGQILDRPEWRMIPELTVCFILFVLFCLGSSVLPYSFQNIKEAGTGEMFAIAILVFIEAVTDLIFKKVVGLWGRNKEDNAPKEKWAYRDELFGYLSYTVIYVSLAFILFTLIEFIILCYGCCAPLKRMYSSMNSKTIYGWELLEMRWISAIGLGFTLKQMIDNFQFTKEKVTKEHISNIKDYLAEKSVKN